MLWHFPSTGTWYVGGKAALGQRKGVLKAHDTAVAPERIKPGLWMVGQGEGKGWLAAAYFVFVVLLGGMGMPTVMIGVI